MLNTIVNFEKMSEFDDGRTPPKGFLVRGKDSNEYCDPGEALIAFVSAQLGNLLVVPIDIVYPSQKDDGVRNYSTEPVPAYLDVDRQTREERIVLETGNHRYHTRISQGDTMIQVQKVENPNTNW